MSADPCSNTRHAHSEYRAHAPDVLTLKGEGGMAGMTSQGKEHLYASGVWLGCAYAMSQAGNRSGEESEPADATQVSTRSSSRRQLKQEWPRSM